MRISRCCCGCHFCAPEQLEVEITNLGAEPYGQKCADCPTVCGVYLVDYVGYRWRTFTGQIPGYIVGHRIKICYWEHEYTTPLCGGTHLRVEAWRQLYGNPEYIQAEVFPFFVDSETPGPSIFLFGYPGWMPETQWCDPQYLDYSGTGRYGNPYPGDPSYPYFEELKAGGLFASIFDYCSWPIPFMPNCYLRGVSE